MAVFLELPTSTNVSLFPVDDILNLNISQLLNYLLLVSTEDFWDFFNDTKMWRDGAEGIVVFGGFKTNFTGQNLFSVGVRRIFTPIDKPFYCIIFKRLRWAVTANFTWFGDRLLQLLVQILLPLSDHVQPMLSHPLQVHLLHTDTFIPTAQMQTSSPKQAMIHQPDSCPCLHPEMFSEKIS